MACTLLARTIALTILCLSLPVILRCEQNIPWRFGLSGGAGVQFHSSGPNLPLPPASAPFTTANGLALFLGLEAERLVAPWLYAAIGVDIQTWNGTFTAEEPSFFIVNGVGTPGIITHSLDLATTSVGITPSFVFPLGSSLLLKPGFRFGYTARNSYEQSQAVTEPANLPFVYGDHRITGELDNMEHLSIAFTAALRYNIPLGTSLALEPELRTFFGVLPLMEHSNWRSNGIQGGVTLVYAPVVQPPVVLRDTVYRRDTVHILVNGIAEERLTLASSKATELRQEREDVILLTIEVEEGYLREIPKPVPLLAAAVDVRFVQKNGGETQSTTLMVEGRMRRHYLPLLPYVFFDEGSAELSEKYRRGMAKPQTGDAMLETYYHVLDTVGVRMKTRPRARLTLAGGVDGKTIGEQLARRRAEAVKAYLAETWDIAPERLRIATRVVPQDVSAVSQAESLEESNRVELASDDERILAPVVLSGIDVIADPPLVRFYPDVVSEAGTALWKLVVSFDGAVLREFSGGGTPPSAIEWDIASTPAAARLLAGDLAPLYYEFSATDTEGAVARSGQGSIRFQQSKETADGSFIRDTTDRFSLILFDFNTAALSAENRAIVRLVRSAVVPKDTLSVLGYSDATGDEAYNKRLSQRRADAIASLLKMPHLRVVGMGIDSGLPHYLPEGRFYSRRVDVVRER